MPKPGDDQYRLRSRDVRKAGEVLADAFRNDPLWEKLFEGEPGVNKKRCAFFETPVRYCVRYGEVYAPSWRLEGIAAWVPGDLADMTPWRMLRSGALWTGMKMGAHLSKKMSRILLTPLREDREKNMGNRSFIYLQIMGVDPAFQGRGFGGMLLGAVIDRGERAGTPVYLETETEENVGLYERFGFTVMKKISLPEIHLPMWEMARGCPPGR